jgi:polysaccharide deacetylase family protein (PEP-CTERM system associated)
MTEKVSPNNMLTFDIEGFFEASVESLHIPDGYYSSRAESHEIETNTMAIVEILAEFGVKGTFFILGRIARDMPHLVNKIASAGHEIACHSMEHRRLFNFGRTEVTTFLKAAKVYLEDASGTEVTGFRPPDFSITNKNLWVHDVLLELGFIYDSGVFPISFHDVYGIGEYGVSPFRLPNGLIELPLSTARVVTNIPLGGGGYFRLYPYFVTKLLAKMVNRRGDPLMYYLHPYEIGRVVPRVKELSGLKKLRTYNNIRHSEKKLKMLLRDFLFLPCRDWIQTHFNS